MSGPPPNYDPNASMLNGGGGAAPPLINMHGGGLPNDYIHGGYKESVLPGGTGPIIEMKGGLRGSTARRGAAEEEEPCSIARRCVRHTTLFRKSHSRAVSYTPSETQDVRGRNPPMRCHPVLMLGA